MIDITKEFLEQKYLIEKLSLGKIAKELNCYASTIQYYIRKYNIPIRSISEALKGRKLTQEHAEKVKKNIIEANNKRHISGVSLEEKERLKSIRFDRTGLKHSVETKEKMKQKAVGRKNSEETKKKMSETRKNNPKYSGENHPLYGLSRKDMKGENNPNWNGGNTSIYRKFRKTTKYIEWRTACYERDNYTCQICNKRGVELNVDHINPFALIIKKNNIKTIEDLYVCEEIWNLNNGRTLCVLCHRQTDTFGTGTQKLLKFVSMRKD